MKRLRERNEWKFFAVLPKASRTLAIGWWVILIFRSVLPAVFAVAMGVVIRRVQQGGSRRGPLLCAAWLATHWLLRESAIWRDRNTDEVRAAQRDSEYAYRLAVDPPAAKELRLFGLAGWVIERFVARRTRLHELQYEATRLREKPVMWSLLLVVSANVLVFWSLANAAISGSLDLGAAIVFAQCALGTLMIA